MSSTGYQILCAVSASVFAWSTYMAWKRGKEESDTQSAADEKRAETRHVVSETNADARHKAIDQKADERRILAEQNAIQRHAETVELLTQRNLSLSDELKQRYPWGYVLFGPDGHSYLPFPKEDLYVEAAWHKTRIDSNFTNKTVTVHIQKPTWTLANTKMTLLARVGEVEQTFALQKGRPEVFRAVSVVGEPHMFFEILDDNQRSPVYVIGFRKPV